MPPSLNFTAATLGSRGARATVGRAARAARRHAPSTRSAVPGSSMPCWSSSWTCQYKDDDAVGEAFDKAAKMFGLPYPGGPEVDRRAELGNPDRFSFSKMQTPGLDFSYSGLKTSILYRIQKETHINPHTLTDDLNDWCASARQALVHPLLERLDRALRPEHRYVVLAGGVAANRLLRREAQEWASRKGIAMGIPPLSYATDNAAMIGAVAYFAFSEQRFSDLGRAASARLEVPSRHD